MRWSRSAAAALLAAWCCGSVAAAQDTVDWQDAATCIGRVCGVRGTVAEAQNEGPVIRLYFDAARRDVYVTLVRGWFVDWPDYAGHAILATGPVDRFRDQIEVMVRDPDGITVLDAPLTATPLPDTPTPLAATPTAPAPTAAEPTVAQPTAAVPTVAAPTIPAPPTVAVPPAAENETEQLRQRVRELEERVRQLEAP